MATGDRASAKTTAHTIKGAAATIGAMTLSQAAAMVEKSIVDDTPDLQENLLLLKKELETCLKAIGTYLDEEQDSRRPNPKQTAPPHISVRNLEDALHRLADLLAAGDMQATGLWKTVKEPLLHSADAQLIVDLDRKIDRLEFSDALGLLRLLSKIFGRGLENDHESEQGKAQDSHRR